MPKPETITAKAFDPEKAQAETIMFMRKEGRKYIRRGERLIRIANKLAADRKDRRRAKR